MVLPEHRTALGDLLIATCPFIVAHSLRGRAGQLRARRADPKACASSRASALGSWTIGRIICASSAPGLAASSRSSPPPSTWAQASPGHPPRRRRRRHARLRATRCHRRPRRRPPLDLQWHGGRRPGPGRAHTRGSTRSRPRSTRWIAQPRRCCPRVSQHGAF